MTTNDLLTYFGLLPNEILITHIRPHLSNVSLCMLRNAYLGTEIPLCLDIFREIFQEDSVNLLNYFGDDADVFCLRDFMDCVEPNVMREVIALIRSAAMARVAMEVFDTYFDRYYFKVRFDNKDKLKQYLNRVLFAGYFDNHDESTDFIVDSLKKGSIYDPLLPHIFPTYQDCPTFLEQLDDSGLPNHVNVLIDIAWNTQSLDLVKKLQTYNIDMISDIESLALKHNAYNFAGQLRLLFGITDEVWYALCLRHDIIGSLPTTVMLRSSMVPMTMFKKCCECENFDAMEKLRPSIDDDSTIVGNFSVAVIKWLYEHRIYPSFDIIICNEELTADDLRYLLSLHLPDIRSSRTWKSLARMGRYDLLLVLKEIGNSPSFVGVTIELKIYNRGVCELFYDLGCRMFDTRRNCALPLEYYQWCVNKQIEHNINDVDNSLYTLKESIWLIEHGFYYNNKCWLITAKDICDLPYITQWLTQHTYTIGNAIIVKKHESQYRE